MVKRKFIQKLKLREGALSKQLGIPIKKNIPMTLLNKIISSEPGKKIHNPTKSGKRIIIVTKLLKERSNLAKTFKTFKRS